MRPMYGVEMQVPTGKLPGFYAQVIHKIGDHVNVFDRDKLLFIVEGEEERDKLEAVLTKSHMLGEVFPLLLLPPQAQVVSLDDTGFISESGNHYLYTDRVALFALALDEGNDRDRWAAEEQLKEHAVGFIPGEVQDTSVWIVDHSLAELVEGIARAYRLSVNWL